MSKQNIDISQLSTGDIFGLTRRKFHILKPKSWLSGLIDYFTRLNKKRKGEEITEVYTQTGIIEMGKSPNLAWAIDSNAKGAGFTLLENRLLSDDFVKRVTFKTPKKKYTEKEKQKLRNAMMELDYYTTKYDFLGLIHQLVLSLTGVWIGPKGERANKRLYCSELTALLSNAVRPGTFKNQHATSPQDVMENRFYILKPFKEYGQTKSG